jgi:hypothetical protein
VLTNAPPKCSIICLGLLLGGAIPSEPALAAECPRPVFQAPKILRAGDSPGSVTVADFNADGRSDLAVTDRASDRVVVLLGNDDGTFSNTVNYTVGTGLASVAAGDLNGDGWIDLVAANQGAYDPIGDSFTNGAVSLLIGNGDGTFHRTNHYLAGTQPRSVAAGDLNGDGLLDLAVADWGSTDISILLGNRDGTFRNAVNFPAGGNPVALVTSDFNGDGWLDVAVAGDFLIAVLPGNGDGSLQAPVPQSAGSRHSSLLAGDFNGDGYPDLVVADYDTRSISILLNNQMGGFRPSVDYEVIATSGLLSMAGGDFNADGAVDLAVGDYDGVSIVLGKGDGTFHTLATHGPPAGAGSVAVGDFNGDGKSDFAAVSLNPRTVWVQLGKGNGAFELPPAYPLASSSFPTSLAMGDFDGNGYADVVVGSASAAPFVSLLLGQADGTFRAPLEYGVGSGAQSVVVGDFNSDGQPDIITANAESTNLSVLLGKGDGTFSNAVNYATGLLPISVASADFDRDGHPDIAVIDDLLSGELSIVFGVHVFKGRGDGTFEPGRPYAAGTNAHHVSVSDFNGDGTPDLAVANYTIPSAVTVLLGKGDGTFEDAVSYDAGGIGAIVVLPGDVDGDGKLDLAVLNSIVNSTTNFSSVSFLLGNGDGTFRSPIRRETEPYARTMALGDFDGDGRLDLATAGWQEQNPIRQDLFPVSVQLGNGDGSFQARFLYAAGTKPQFLLARDLNHDGRSDLAVASVGPTSGASVSLLINLCSPGQSELNLSIAPGTLSLNLSWPSPATGYVLEFTTNLTSLDWQTATEVLTTNNGRFEVSVPLNQQERYFRLRKP